MKKLLILLLICTLILPNFSLAYIENTPRETTETKKVDTAVIEQKVKNIKVPTFVKRITAPIDSIRSNRAIYFKTKIETIDADDKSKIEKLAQENEILKDDSVNYKKMMYQFLYFVFSNPIIFYVLVVCIVALAIRILTNFFI